MRILRQYHVNIHRKIIFAKQYLYSKYDIRYRIAVYNITSNYLKFTNEVKSCSQQHQIYTSSHLKSDNEVKIKAKISCFAW